MKAKHTYLLALLLFALSHPTHAAFFLFPASSHCGSDLRKLSVPELPKDQQVLVMTPRFHIVKIPGQRDLQVVSNQTGQLMGVITFDLYGDKVVRADPTTAEGVRGEGVMTEAKYAVLKYAFSELGAKKSSAYIPADNIPSRNLHKKLGYIEIPPLHYKSIVYELTAEDFKKVDKKFQAPGPGFEQFLPTRRQSNSPLQPTRQP